MMTTPNHLYQYEFNTLEELLGQLAESVESEQVGAWRKAWLCAAARHQYDGDRALTGKLAETLSCSRQHVRRFISVGETFPPDMVVYERPINLYLEALKADDPHAAIELALDNEWSVKQLREHLATGDDNPGVTIEILNTELSPRLNSSMEGVKFMVNDALLTAKNQRGYGELLSVKIRIVAEYEGATDD